VEYKMGRIAKIWSVHKTKCITNFFINPINKVMSMEQIFQNISKQMLETTYILRLAQLLKITPNFKNLCGSN
jgi:hypothetical protein